MNAADESSNEFTNEFIQSASPIVSHATTRGHLGDCDILTSFICFSDGYSQQ
jgi:hypothetical protein